MEIPFYKYQGTGNDFVVIDNRDLKFPKSDTKLIKHMCDRKFGIGADGLILLENHLEKDFQMVYFNSDGNEGSMCGNGGRCLVAFAKFLDIFTDKTSFMAVDGIHEAYIQNDLVHLKMMDVENVVSLDVYSFLDTGSPHHVQLVSNLDQLDVCKEGARLRYGKYGAVGANINFVEILGENNFRVRTYERGVENETLSCGTGVTAVALAMHYTSNTSSNQVDLEVEGGGLSVHFTPKDEGGYRNIFLIGDANQVFKGVWK